eukprot:TRINITY_DN4362_c0_g2_i1.p1 TRINITY_DN4362_c0_g2~~TRINITY_DN4362_c0_g2_i1.p1  ORF type:complete len:118 (-),score=22.21 TRINITY_DN4362_c0_g2_i1:382-735(-)
MVFCQKWLLQTKEEEKKEKKKKKKRQLVKSAEQTKRREGDNKRRQKEIICWLLATGLQRSALCAVRFSFFNHFFKAPFSSKKRRIQQLAGGGIRKGKNVTSSSSIKIHNKHKWHALF